MKLPPVVSIIVLAHNQEDFTRNCLRTIMRYTEQPYELILIDNGSSSGIRKLFASESSRGAKVIYNKENLGYAAGVNQGLEMATGRYILLLNNDTLVTAGWLGRLIAAAESRPEIGVVGSITNYARPGPQMYGQQYTTIAAMEAWARQIAERNKGSLTHVSSVIGMCMLVKRSCFEKVGLFDERFGIGNWEDEDYCYRVRKAGYQIVVANDCWVHHHGSATFRATGVDYAALMEENKRKYEEKWRNGTPYLIAIWDYQHNSGGIRAMHRLCHELNMAGQEAYVPSQPNPDWLERTADAKTVAELLARNAIVVYPEIVPGNPLNASRVVRWLLNKPALLGGDATYAPEEVLFCYGKDLVQFVPSEERILTVPIIETELFRDDGLARLGGCFWVGKGKAVPRIPQTEGLTEITYSWPSTRQELARLFKTSDVFYSYDNFSALLAEARLCGCPTVLIPDGRFTKKQAEEYFLSLDGLAWGPSEEEVERARETVMSYPSAYAEYVAPFARELRLFIESTQNGGYWDVFEKAKDREALIVKARVDMANGNIASANELLERAIELAPGDYGLEILLVECYKGGGKMQEAYDLLCDRLACEPDNLDARARLANLLMELEELDTALEVLGQGLDMYPNEPLIYERLGAVFSKLDRYEDALNAYNVALSLDPQHPGLCDAIEAIQILSTIGI